MLNSLSNASMKRNVSSRRVAPGTAGSQSILNPCNTDLWYHNTIVIRKYKRLFQIVKSYHALFVNVKRRKNSLICDMFQRNNMRPNP